MAPGGAHNHRAPLPYEIRYLKVQYHARVFCVTNLSVVGLTAFLDGMITLYHQPRALRWPESQEQVLHDQREASAKAKRAKRSARRLELLENLLGYAGDGGQGPEPALKLNEGEPPVENVAAVQPDQGMTENLDEFADPVDQVHPERCST